ncbi:MAG: hypothetical protein ABI432_17650 [Flavobacteriales bacterium]
MRPILIAFAFLAASSMVEAQNVAINSTGVAPAASAMLDITSANSGVLIPRIALSATTVAAPVAAPATSLLVYNTATAGAAPTNVTPGYYYWDGAQWVRFAGATDAWLTTGNAGTVPGTHFIGTTDAKDWLIKTGGSAATNERLRVLSAGQVVQNNTGIVAGDVFSVYSNNTTTGALPSINNAIGTFAVNGYAAGNGTGVYGETDGGASTAGTALWGNIFGTATTASSTSEGVYGTNSTAPAGTGVTAGVATGVRGESIGAAGTAFTMGVLGINTATTGSAFGLYGQNSSPGAFGVFGVNLDATANVGHGVQGQAGGFGGAAGVRGFNTAAAIGAAQSGYGVRGSATVAPTGTGFVIGVRGDATGATGNTYGVYGQAGSATGFGMDGVNTNASGTGLITIGNNAAGTYLVAGSGIASNAAGIGTFSIAKTVASGIGVVGVGNNLVASILAPLSGCGVAGTGAQYGVMGFATTTVNVNPATNAAASGAAASAGGYFEVQAGGVAQTWAYVGVRDNTATLRKIIGPGTVNTVVRDLQGERVALACPEAPENLFQDYGAASLVNGRAHVSIDPVFAKNIAVNAAHPLRVFVQLEGDCAGVYVTNKTANGFDVIELNGGTSDTPFTYTIVANRADETNPDGTIAHYSAERFPPAPGPQATVAMASHEANDAAARKDQVDAPFDPPTRITGKTPKHVK